MRTRTGHSFHHITPRTVPGNITNILAEGRKELINPGSVVNVQLKTQTVRYTG